MKAPAAQCARSSTAGASGLPAPAATSWLVARLGVRTLTIIGIVLALTGTVPYALIDDHPDQLLLGAALVVRGLGLGASMMPTMTVAFASVPKETGRARPARSTSSSGWLPHWARRCSPLSCNSG